MRYCIGANVGVYCWNICMLPLDPSSRIFFPEHGPSEALHMYIQQEVM